MVNGKKPILRVENLRVEFHTEDRRVVAVNDVSFTLHEGESLGVVGESGSGKTVTALSILGLLPPVITHIPEESHIWFASETLGEVDLLHTTQRMLRQIRGGQISIVFQEPMTSLNPVFRCGEQVMEAILAHEPEVSKQEARDRVLELFRRVGLDDAHRIFRSYPHQLSGGQKQRVMIAMALACTPKIVIADEPTTALDVTVQKKILELLRELQEEYNMALIFISHDLGVIAEIADRVLVMYRGDLVEDNDIHTIFHAPRHPYTRGLLACRPPLDVKLRSLPTLWDFMEVTPEGEIRAKTEKSVEEVLAERVIPREEIQRRVERLVQQEPLLVVRDLKVYFPARRNLLGKPVAWFPAVDGVSFEVYPGETLGLVGESGSGKTTLSRAILRLIDPTDGTVLFDGKNVTAMEGSALRALRREMQIIFQDPYSSLNPRLTVGYAIEEPMRVHGLCTSSGECRDRAMELLEKVKLEPEHYYRYPHEFSGGQRQRICIARALAVQPRFIICDEAVSSLDVSVQAEILNLLNQLKEEYNLTYIFISHDLSVVKFMSDRIMVMYRGRIEEIGPSEEIYENPKSEYTRRLIAAIPRGERLYARP